MHPSTCPLSNGALGRMGTEAHAIMTAVNMARDSMERNEYSSGIVFYESAADLIAK